MIDENQEIRQEIRQLYADRNFIFVPSGPGSLLYKNGIFVPMLGYEVLYDDDFYPVANGNKFSIKHTALMKLSRCAGIEWETESDKVGRVDRMNNENYCSYRMVAQIRLADGRLEPYPAQKHIDLSEEANKAIVQAEKNFNWLDQNKGKIIKGKKISAPYPAEKSKFIDLKVGVAVGQKRAHIDELCESGAQNRAIIKALLIPSFDPLRDDRKRCCMSGNKFYIVRYILDPTRQDVLSAQLGQLAQAKANVYGIAPQQQTQALPEPKDVTPPDDPDPDSEFTDFENLSFDEKIATIEEAAKKADYNMKDDILKHGELCGWKDDNLIDYFKHIKGGKI